MKIGSEDHKELFCGSFMESHWQYEPAELPWPELDDDYLERLRSIPFWDEALRTELEAGEAVSEFADTQHDPLVREAIALQGKEEARHARLLQFMIERYGIPATPLPLRRFDPNLRKNFIYFGYGECLDAFGAFGLFELARQAAYMPEAFFAIFDRVLDEEARHIVFFINWMVYQQVRSGRGVPSRAVTAVWNYAKVLRHLIAVIRDAGNENESFATTGGKAFMMDLTPRILLETSLKENERRMANFHGKLLRPRLMPAIARVALTGVKLIPHRRRTA